MGNGATDTVLRSAGQTGVTRLASLPLMGPVPSSPGHLTAHLINPPPRPAQASFPIHTLWLLELRKLSCEQASAGTKPSFGAT